MAQSTCSIDGCTGTHRARGMCGSHVAKWRRYGDPLATGRGPNGTHKQRGINGRLSQAAVTGEKLCGKCGTVLPLASFYSDKSRIDGRTTYCKDCTKPIVKAWHAKNPNVMKDFQHRRRARMLGTATGPIDYDLLWSNSGGKCGICGDMMDTGETFPHPRSVSVDHIIPLAKGGTHTQDNLQYACLGCNVRKGDRI